MTDYTADIQKFTKNVNESAVATIIKYCGIALRGKDSRYVSISDSAEVKRVVDGFCAKKLGLDKKAAESAIAKVGDRMKEDKTKSRVTVYYLIAEETGTLSKLA